MNNNNNEQEKKIISCGWSLSKERKIKIRRIFSPSLCRTEKRVVKKKDLKSVSGKKPAGGFI